MLALALLVGTGLLLLAAAPWQRALALDAATWDSLAIGLTRGEIPYRDIFLHKTPGAAFLGAIGASVAGLFGVEPVFGAHAVFLLLGALAPALLFALVRRRLPRTEALSCAVFLLAWEAWPLAALEGTRPKVATVTLGLLSMALAGAKPRGPSGLLAGLAAAAAATCWQPGIVFAPAAVAERFQSTLRSTRVEQRVWFYSFALGLAVLPMLLLSWLAAHNALDDFIQQTLFFNVDYVERGLRPFSLGLPKILSTIANFSAAELVLLPIALIGVAIAPRTVAPGIAVSGIAYLGLAFVSFQGWPDTLLLLPLFAVLLGAGLSAGAQVLWDRRVGPPAVFAFALWAALTPNWERLGRAVTFQEQRATMNQLTNDLDPTSAIVAIGTPEILLHANRGRDWRWPYFWFGVDEFAAAQMGDFDAVLADLQRLDPALITVARRWRGPHRNHFEAWAATRYEKTRLAVYPHRIEPINVYKKVPVPN